MVGGCGGGNMRLDFSSAGADGEGQAALDGLLGNFLFILAILLQLVEKYPPKTFWITQIARLEARKRYVDRSVVA